MSLTLLTRFRPLYPATAPKVLYPRWCRTSRGLFRMDVLHSSRAPQRRRRAWPVRSILPALPCPSRGHEEAAGSCPLGRLWLALRRYPWASLLTYPLGSLSPVVQVRDLRCDVKVLECNPSGYETRITEPPGRHALGGSFIARENITILVSIFKRKSCLVEFFPSEGYPV